MARSEGNRRPRPRLCSDGVMSGCSPKDHDMGMQSNSDEDEAKEMHCSIDEDGAVEK